MLSRLVNPAGTMSSNVAPGLKKRPVFANSRRGPLPDRKVCSAGYSGLIGSATTPSTTCNGATTSTAAAPLQSSTDSPGGVAEDVDGPCGRVEACPDLVAGPVFPVPDLTVPLVQLASSIAITAAVTRAEPRRVGRMASVCHRLSHVQVRGDYVRPRRDRRPAGPDGSGDVVATFVGQHGLRGANHRWIVMRDPDDNEFCVAAAPRLISGKDPDGSPAGASIRKIGARARAFRRSFQVGTLDPGKPCPPVDRH